MSSNRTSVESARFHLSEYGVYEELRPGLPRACAVPHCFRRGDWGMIMLESVITRGKTYRR